MGEEGAARKWAIGLGSAAVIIAGLAAYQWVDLDGTGTSVSATLAFGCTRSVELLVDQPPASVSGWLCRDNFQCSPPSGFTNCSVEAAVDVTGTGVVGVEMTLRDYTLGCGNETPVPEGCSATDTTEVPSGGYEVTCRGLGTAYQVEFSCQGTLTFV